jgi:hypothetical protein
MPELAPTSPAPKPPGVWRRPVITANNNEAVGRSAGVWLPVTLVQVLPTWSSFSLGACASRDKPIQEDDLCEVDGLSPAYNEQLQDDVYLQEGLRATATRLLAGSFSTVTSRGSASSRAASRTPSPPPLAGLHPDASQLGRHSSLQDMLEWQQSIVKAQPSDAEFDDEPIPVKHTFIHYGSHDTIFEQRQRRLVRSVSAPGNLMDGRFRQKIAPMTLAHTRRECKPCAYMSKQDGCRLADDCAFCHWCTGIDIKKRKKEKKRTLKQLSRKLYKASCAEWSL